MYRALSAFFAILLIADLSLAYVSPGSPTGHVNDFAGTLSPATKQSLETELTQFEKDTSNEIAVAIVPNMAGDYIENYAVKLFEDWGVGKKDKDNGVLLVIALEERELRIEVGYGLEGALPDSVAQRILDNEMTPQLRNNDVDGAVTAAVHAIVSATKGEYSPTETQPNPFTWLGENFQWLFVGVIVAFQWLASILGRSKRWWPGGVLGLVAGAGVGTFLAFNVSVIALTAALLSVLGLLFDFAVSRSYHANIGKGTTPPWWAGGSGGFGGRSSGGFGGFGGGSSGGGGASGRW